ncbi:cyclic nucleotide-binding domain-containing protein [Parvibaculum sp.]|uniref:cyclic nucleotide-binding domain-containing protein n=1 Tax=Parvibaculum sp. TaxID=2024848 RepID=UPI00320F0EDB
MHYSMWRRAVMSRHWQVILHGALLAMCSAFGSTLAASLFLANAGANAVPIYYLILAAASIPVSLLFSSVIDRWPRRTTMTGLLVIYMASAIGLAALMSQSIASFYVLYTVISVCELMIYSIYYILFSDYFSVLDAKRYSGAMTIALGVGAMAGSLLVSYLTGIFEAREVLLALPILVLLALAHLLWLTKREQPLDEVESAAEENMLESLGLLPRIIQRHPIILLMAASVFFNIVGQCVMEFEAFSIYADNFPDETQLASFLGEMTAIVDLVGILVVFFVSNPLISRIGVARLAIVPAVINLVSFIVLAASSSLSAGVLAHLNYYPLEHSLNVPVFALIYNAIPYRFAGRVRVINDGIIYPLALAASGILLLVVEPHLTLSQIAMVGGVVALLYVAAQAGIGRQYLRSLVDMLRKGSVELDQVGEGLVLPDAYRRDIASLLRDHDKENVILGAELAMRAKIEPDDSDLARALPMLPPPVARSVILSLGRNNPAAAEARLRRLLESPEAGTRLAAIEGLLVRRMITNPADPALPLLDSDPELRLVAKAGAAALSGAVPEAASPDGGPGERAAMAALNILRALKRGDLFSLYAGMLHHSAPSVRAAALRLAADFGTLGDQDLLDWARSALSDGDASARAASAALLATITAEEKLEPLSRNLFAKEDPAVRRAAAAALTRRGALGLDILTSRLLEAGHSLACDIMDGLGNAGPEIADPILFDFLTRRTFPDIRRNLAASDHIPANRPGWRPLELAIANSNTQIVQSVLQALSVLDYKRVLGAVRHAMNARDERTRANAIETLSSLAHRHYVLPLMPILEADASAAHSPVFDPEAARSLLSELMSADDDFIRAAAMTTWAAEFGTLPASPPNTPDGIVLATMNAFSRNSNPSRFDEVLPMNRLAFLKSVPLFAQMTLDHLMAVDNVMTRQTYLPGERIVREGEAGDKLFIVLSGEVVVRKQTEDGAERDLARLTSGELFGEMALFDEEPRSASVIALTDADFLALERDHFLSLAFQRPDIPMQVCKVLVSRLRNANT